MTNEEARAIMTALKQSYINLRTNSDLKKKTVKENIKAYDMAIKALETIPKYKDAYNKGWDDGAKATYEHLKMCEEEQGGDLISRERAISLADELKDDLPDDEHLADMVVAHNEGILEYQKQLNLLPPVNPQPCEDSNANQHNSNALNALEGDAISRQKVLDNLSELNAISFYEAQEDSKEAYYEIRQSIKNMPPVNTQKQETGHWIPHVNGIWIEYYECSKCGKVHDTQSDYCEKCGIRMIEPQEKDIIWYDKRNYSEIVVKPEESEDTK